MSPALFSDIVERMGEVVASRVGVSCPRRNACRESSPNNIVGVAGSSAPPLLQLPDDLQHRLAAFVSVSDTSCLSLASKRARKHVWENPCIWFAIVQASPDSPNSGVVAPCAAGTCPLRDLQSAVRRSRCGIDTLMNDVTTAQTTLPQLELARQAIRCLRAADGIELIERVAGSLATLLRQRCRESNRVLDSRLEDAARIVLDQAVTCELFTSQHMCNMVGAQQEAEQRSLLDAAQEAYLLTSMELLEEFDCEHEESMLLYC